MDNWQTRSVWARQGLFVLDCPSRATYRACYQYRVLLPPVGVLILMLWLALSAYKRRQSFIRLLSLGLSVTASPFAKTHGVHGETVFDCTNAKNTIADVDLSVVEECLDFTSTYGKPTLVRTQILQCTASTLVKMYTCNLIISREACQCK